MGLWMSKRVVLLHSGMIWAHSDGDEKGTTFHLELPIGLSLVSKEYEIVMALSANRPVKNLLCVNNLTAN